MQRKSTLFLIVALVLAVSVPLFAFAETAPAAQPADGTGYQLGRCGIAYDITDAQGNLYDLTRGYSVDGEGNCFFLDANGAAQPLYARTADGQMTALRLANGTFCWALGADDAAQTTTQTRGNFMNGRGCRRWN